MRRIMIALIFLLIFPAISTANRTHVGYEKDIQAGSPLFLDVDSDGTIFTSQDNRTITVMDSGGNVKSILGGKDKKWKDILKEPEGLALYGGKLYVVDSGLGRISVFSKEGELLESFGSMGSKAGQFSSPGGIAVYKGMIYVADTGNRRVQVLGKNGVYLGSIGVAGEEENVLKKPVDLFVDHRGLIYVVDEQDKLLKVYSPDGQYKGFVKGLTEPHSLAFTEDGYYVSDGESYSIKKFDYENRFLVTFGSKGNGRAQFEALGGIDVGPGGKVYVADPRRGLIQIFSPERMSDVAPLEYAPPPTSVLWTSDQDVLLDTLAWDPAKKLLYGVNSKQKAVLAWKNGQVLKKITLDNVVPIGVAVAKDGGLLVVDGKKKFVYKLKPETYEVDYHFGGSGGREGAFKSPSDIVVSLTGDVFVSDKAAQRIQVFSFAGVFVGVLGRGGTEDLLQGPTDMDFDSSNMLYVLDEKKKSVLIFGTSGNLIKEFGGESDAGNVFSKPAALAVTDNEVFVLDLDGPVIKVFDKQGNFVRVFGSPGNRKVRGNGEMVDPVALLATDNVHLFVSDPGSGRVQGLVNVYTPSVLQGVGARGATRSVMTFWDENTESFVGGYVVYRSDKEEGPYVKIAGSDKNSFIDNGLEPDRPYYYRIAAVADHGNIGPLSAPVMATPVKFTASPPTRLVSDPQEWSVKLSWTPVEGDHVGYYVIYRAEAGALVEVGKAQETEFVVGSLSPDTEYSFSVSSVSSDEVESEKVSVETKTLVATRPPIEIELVKIDDLFSNTYKNYESEGLGKIKIINNTMDNISRMKVAFTIKDFMDFPWETEVRDLAPRGESEVDLKAVFNNRILEVTEDTPVQTEIKVSYYANQEVRSYSSNHTIKVFEKHKMKWDVRERMAAFVTTKDAVILEFTRGIITQYRDTSEPLLYGSVFFDALGMLGMTYIVDPSTPYQETSNNIDMVDYLQYPRETLKRKSGDCDDLVTLYASSLESLGIRTKVLDIPGHMFMMFEVGKVETLGTDTHDNFFVIYDDSVWVPVEATMVGKTFMEAWEEGSKKYYKWQPEGLLGVMDLRDSWAMFKPANLPLTDWRPKELKRVDIEKKFNKEFQKIRQIRVKLRSKRYITALQENPNDINAYIQLGIVFAESGELKEAAKSFEKAIKLEPENATVINNMGNIHFLEGMYGKARNAYENAAKIEPEDPYVWVNLTKAYLRLDMKKEAKDAFAEAYRLDPVVSRKYRGLSLELLGPV